jgi:hypothetical protein
MIALAQNKNIISTGGLYYMSYGNVYQDKKSGHWYIQLRWDNQTERFYQFEYKDKWSLLTDKNKNVKEKNMSKKILVSVSTSKVGSKVQRTITVDDDEDEVSIEEYAKETMLEMISWDYEILD